MHRVLPALAVCFDSHKLFYLLVVISLSLLHTTIFEHLEFMAAMDVVLVSPGGTTAGVSFLGSEQPQNPPVHREARLSGGDRALEPCAVPADQGSESGRPPSFAEKK